MVSALASRFLGPTSRHYPSPLGCVAVETQERQAVVNRSCLPASAASGPEDLLGGPAAEVATRRETLRARTLPAYYALVWGHGGAGRQPQEPRGAGRAGGNGAPPNVFLNSSPEVAGGEPRQPARQPRLG